MALVVTLNTDGTKGTLNTNSLGVGGLKWIDYVSGYIKATSPTVNTIIATGKVYNYTYSSGVKYRLVPNKNNSEVDSFYSNFTGGVLSGLLAQKTQTL